MTSQQVDPDNDIDVLDDKFETVPSIFEVHVALMILKKFNYTKYDRTDAERKDCLY